MVRLYLLSANFSDLQYYRSITAHRLRPGLRPYSQVDMGKECWSMTLVMRVPCLPLHLHINVTGRNFVSGIRLVGLTLTSDLVFFVYISDSWQIQDEHALALMNNS